MSVEITLAIEGTEEFTQAMSRLDSKMQTKIQERLAEWAEKVKTDATHMVPVKTGYLRSTIYTKTQQWQTQVGAEAAYAAAVEFGTRYAQAKPFLQPALQQHLPELEQTILDALDSAQTEASL